jgi:transcription termination factor NusB
MTLVSIAGIGYLSTGTGDKYLEVIGELTFGYSINRIHSADKCVLLIGIAELDNFKETDVPVIVDESVKLASVFCSEKSTDFINGILAEYAKRR